jgi:4-hydroxy-4-methyl-2-oxoglutarate aldolase
VISRTPLDALSSNGLSTNLLSIKLASVLGRPVSEFFLSKIRPLWPLQTEAVIAGPAVTIVKQPLSNEIPHISAQTNEIYEKIKLGDIVVVVGSGEYFASWGDSMSSRALAKGAGAALIHGYVHDPEDIRKVGLPVFCLGTKNIPHTQITDFNIQVNFADIVINPGDIVVLDNFGVMVIPRLRIEDVLDEVRKLSVKNQDEK